MKIYIFVFLFIISSNTSAVDSFLKCSSSLPIEGISTQVSKAINNICSDKFLGFKALFIVAPESLPDNFYKIIIDDNFYIFDQRSDTIYLIFDKFMSILYLKTPHLNRGPIIFGSSLVKSPDYPWLNNWFNQTKSVNSVNALVSANTDSLNYFFEGVNKYHYHKRSHGHENTYKYALIGVCAVGAILLVTTNLINYLYTKKHKLKKDKTLLLNSDSNDSNNPI